MTDLSIHQLLSLFQHWYTDVIAGDGLFVVLTATLATFVSVFFRGFQNKNVAGGHKKMAFFTGYIMNVLDIVVIGMVVNSGVGVVIISGLGAAFGYLTSMQVHEYFIERKLKEQKRIEKLIKKERRRAALENLVAEAIQANEKSKLTIE